MPAIATASLIREDLASLAQRVQREGYVVATDGNCSARLPDGNVVITPSGVRKGDVQPEDLVLCAPDGRVLERGRGDRGPSSELKLHLTVYRVRDDVQVICHAHPKTAVALSLAGLEVASCLLPEILIAVGKLSTAPYGTPTTQAAADAVRLVCRDAQAIVLDRHGSVTLGRSFDEAFHLLERLEWAAQVTRDARQLAGPDGLKRLPTGEVERLLDVRAQLSGEPRREPCNLCGTCIAGSL
jgi:L-fuculose-phosphate aldolase